MQSSKQKRQKQCTLTLQFFTNSISYQGCSTLMCDVINSLRRTVNFSIRLTSCLKVYAGESLKCNRNSFQRTGESFSTLRQQTGCGTRLFSSFLAYIYKNIQRTEESFVLVIRFAIKVAQCSQLFLKYFTHFRFRFGGLKQECSAQSTTCTGV